MLPSASALPFKRERSPGGTSQRANNWTSEMALTTLIYASKSRLAPETAQDAVVELVAKARCWNSEVGITGALLFDGAHFVQVIEGSAASIDLLLPKLLADPRHDGLVVAKHGPLAERQFSAWSLAYSGSSKFVTNHIMPMFDDANPAGQRRASHRMIDFMREFVKS